MEVQPPRSPLLCTTWPNFAAALDESGHAQLTEQVERSRVIDMCSCGDDFCQSFYTAPKPPGPYGEGHYDVCLDAPWPGYLILDVVDDDIVYVEVLHRSPLR